MKIAIALAALLGLSLTIGLVAYFGLDGILRSLEAVGWGGFAVLCAAQLALIPLLGTAWTVLAPYPPMRWRAMVIGRLLRDAATEALPFSPLGGLLIGTRGAVLSGAPAPLVLATGAVDMAMEFAAQIAYVALGLSLLFWNRAPAAAGFSLASLAAGLGLATAMAIGFILAQRYALRPLSERLAASIPRSFHASADAFHDLIAAIYRRPGRLALSMGLHLCGWIASAGGTWLALYYLGHPIGFAPLIAMESLLYAARSAAFFVPVGIGVQEGAYAMLGPMFGIPAEAALTLSLLKRARDLVIAALVLGLWQLVEGQRLFGRRANASR